MNGVCSPAGEFPKHLLAVKLPCESNHLSFRVRDKDLNGFPLLHFAASFWFQTKACNAEVDASQAKGHPGCVQ